MSLGELALLVSLLKLKSRFGPNDQIRRTQAMSRLSRFVSWGWFPARPWAFAVSWLGYWARVLMIDLVLIRDFFFFFESVKDISQIG